MTDDPLASATLARLYLEQGHLDRARAVVRAALDRNPFDGRALVLARRIERLARPGLAGESDGTRLAIRWHHLSQPHTAYLTVRWFDDAGTLVGGHTLACETANGERVLFWPATAAAAACSIRRCRDRGEPPVPIAVARTIPRRPSAP